jgi:hypothetical protein
MSHNQSGASAPQTIYHEWIGHTTRMYTTNHWIVNCTSEPSTVLSDGHEQPAGDELRVIYEKHDQVVVIDPRSDRE